MAAALEEPQMAVTLTARRNARAMLKRALEDRNPHIDQYADGYLHRIASLVEIGAFKATAPHATVAAYRDLVRKLASNLARNRKLQAALCRRDISGDELSKMTDDELATDVELEQRRRHVDLHRTRTTRNAWAECARTTDHPCPQCRSGADIAYVHVSGVRDIRKAETWGGGLSMESETTTRLHCLGCQHEWTLG